MHTLNKIPFFQEIEQSENILLAGAGGGFDIYAGLPIYFNLKKQGKNVILANFSFTWLTQTTSEMIVPFCYKIKGGDSDLSGRNYFPEKYLHQYLTQQGDWATLYAFDRVGVKPIRDAYKYIIKEHKIDTVILIDGGTDSLMFGDEERREYQRFVKSFQIERVSQRRLNLRLSWKWKKDSPSNANYSMLWQMKTKGSFAYFS